MLIAVEGIDGSGKTTLLDDLEKALCTGRAIGRFRLAPEMVRAYKDMIDRQVGREAEYQYVIPSAFRHLSYVIETVLQFRAHQQYYESFDVLLFDRWLHTNFAYLDPVEFNWDWCKRLLETLPVPDRVYFIDADPAAAARRLAERRDWMSDRMDEGALIEHLAKLRRRYLYVLELLPAVRIDGRLRREVMVERVLADLRGSVGS